MFNKFKSDKKTPEIQLRHIIDTTGGRPPIGAEVFTACGVEITYNGPPPVDRPVCAACANVLMRDYREMRGNLIKAAEQEADFVSRMNTALKALTPPCGCGCNSADDEDEGF